MITRYETLVTESSHYVDPTEIFDLDTLWLAGRMSSIKAVLAGQFPYTHEYVSSNSFTLKEAVEYVDTMGGFQDNWTGLSYSCHDFFHGRTTKHFVAFRNDKDMMTYKMSTQQNE